MKILLISIVVAFTALGFAAAQQVDSDDRHEGGKTRDHHQDGETHDEHGHGHAVSNLVGPDKAVLEANEASGFLLRPGVEERLGIESQPLATGKVGQVPRAAIVYSKEDYQVFRKRDGFWKAIDVKVLRKREFFTIATDDLKKGDSIAVQGAGLLKIVEQSVFGPAIEGHIH